MIRVGVELELDNEFAFEKELHKSIALLYEWLDDELSLQPEHLKEQILDGCNNLSTNYLERSI